MKSTQIFVRPGANLGEDSTMWLWFSALSPDRQHTQVFRYHDVWVI